MARKKRTKQGGGRVTPKGTRPVGYVPRAKGDGCCSACTPPATPKAD